MSYIGLNTAATGMIAADIAISVLAHNVANGNSTAYHRQRAAMHDLGYMEFLRSGIYDVNDLRYAKGIQIGLGAVVGGIYTIHEQGEPEITHSPLDLMINGTGYFRLINPQTNEVFYTRNGVFSINGETREIVQNGLLLSPGLALPEVYKEIRISSTGIIYAVQDDPAPAIEVGQIDLVMFDNDNGLERQGNSLAKATTASGPEILGVAETNLYGSIRQGQLESSNVNMVLEMNELVKANRNYEINANIFTREAEKAAILAKISA